MAALTCVTDAGTALGIGGRGTSGAGLGGGPFLPKDERLRGREGNGDVDGTGGRGADGGGC